MSAPNLKPAPEALDTGACDRLIEWMDRRADVDSAEFRAGDFLLHYWPDRNQREILSGLLGEVFRLRRVVVDLEADFAAIRAGRALQKRGVTVADIIQAAAMAFKVLPASVRSCDGNWQVVAARQVAVFVARSVFRFTLEQVAAQLWRHEIADIQRMFDMFEVRRSQFAEQLDLTMNALRGLQ